MIVAAANEVTSAWSYAGATSTTSADIKFNPDKPLRTFTISLVVMPAISGVPVPGANAGSNTSISIDKYNGLLPTLFLFFLQFYLYLEFEIHRSE